MAVACGIAAPVMGAGSAREEAAAWRSAFDARPVVSQRERVIVVLEAPSLADRIARAGGSATAARQKRWLRAIERGQEQLLVALRGRGAEVEPDLVFTRTLNGFSATVDGRARAALEQARGVAGVYPVRTVYPASVTSAALEQPAFAEGAGRRPGIALTGFDGTGVTVALLDTGVDLQHPGLAGRLLPGIDLIDGDDDASAEASPLDGNALERHGTRMAGLVVGAGGPAGLAGVAPGARLLPIRVLGWQPLADGSWQVYGRGDQLLAGIERAVDPDGDGVVDDHARVALAALIEPYAAFADSPEARAVAGAAVIGTLVVAPVGNDGPSLAGFGTVGAPASAAHALAVGAADLRDGVARASARVSIDGVVAFEGDLPVLGAVGLNAPVELDAAAAGGDVAGRAVMLATPATDLAAAARDAAAAGAAAVVAADADLPAGSVDLEEGAAIPLVELPADAARAVSDSLAAGVPVRVTLAPLEAAANPSDETVAPFSSRGLTFDGRLRPDVVAPGIGIATTDAGLAADGSARYATVTGSSAAAAVAAGTAALVAQARPGLSASQLRGVLVGGARPLAGASYAPAAFQGAGAVDAAGAAALEVVIEPVSLVLGRIGSTAYSGELSLVTTNLSPRTLSLGFGLIPDGDAAEKLRFNADPARVQLAPGESRSVRFTVSGSGGLADRKWVSGTVVAAADGGPATRIPWATALVAAPQRPLVSAARLSRDAFEANGSLGALLTFRAGWLGEGDDGIAIGALGLLEIELWRGETRIGTIARLRDLLPGRYAVGITGRDSTGALLAPGRYQVRFVTRPADGADGSARTVEGPVFRVLAPARTVAAVAGLRWGGEQFGAEEQARFATWLAERGAAYEDWRVRFADVACQAFDDCA